MKQKNKNMTAMALIITMLAAVTVIGGMHLLPQVGVPDADTADTIQYHANVCAYLNDNLIECKHNTLTTTGKNYIKTSLGMGTVNNISTLVLGNTTAPAVGDTVLAGNYSVGGLDPAQGAYNSNGNGNWSIAHTWTATGNGYAVNTTGLYKTSGDMFAGTSFTVTTLNVDDQLKINYTIWVS